MCFFNLLIIINTLFTLQKNRSSEYKINSLYKPMHSNKIFQDFLKKIVHSKKAATEWAPGVIKLKWINLQSTFKTNIYLFSVKKLK